MAEDLIVNYVHPLFLKDKFAASREDNTNGREVTTGVFSDNYWKLMKIETSTLEYMGAWEIVDRGNSMNVIDLTLDPKCKCYTDGLVKEFKARLCTRGDQQLEGVFFFETYALVVQWTTVRLMFILGLLLGKSNQGGVNAAFLHPYIPENEKVYVETPRGF